MIEESNTIVLFDTRNRELVRVLQHGLGVPADGIWGPTTAGAWQRLARQSLPDADPPLFDMPLKWLPTARMSRVIVHWTGGDHRASELDKRHYHILIESDGALVRGDHPIIANEVIKGKRSSQYAAHVARLNTGSIGIGLCGMAGAKESPLDLGRYPFTVKQWDRACEVLAVLCDRYMITVSNKTVLTHAEVEPNLGVKQAGKWDITVLEFATMRGAKPIGDMLREQVLAKLARMKRG